MYYKIKDLLLEIKWAFQRVFRKFDDSAYWDLQFYLTEIIIPVLEYYRDKGTGHPTNQSEEEWKARLDKMIKAFKIIEQGEIIQDTKVIDEGLKEFANNYQNLWD